MNMIVCGVLCLILLVIITNPNFLKFKGINSFRQDQLIQKEKDDRKLTFLYKFGNSVKEETKENISRYTIVSDNGVRTLVVTYEKKFKNILYFVYMYSISNKLIGVLEVEEHATKNTSEEISLPKICKKVNIVVAKVEENEYMLKPIKEISFIKLLFYSIFQTACLAMMIIFASMLFLSPVETTLQGIYTITAVLCFLNFLAVLLILCRRNKR